MGDLLPAAVAVGLLLAALYLTARSVCPVRGVVWRLLAGVVAWHAGERIWLDFRIGKAMMGEEITLRRPPLIEVAAAGTAELEKAEIVRNGETIFCRATSHDRMKFAFVDEKIKKGENYYYLRVTQVDGETAWSSPIWVNFRR